MDRRLTDKNMERKREKFSRFARNSANRLELLVFAAMEDVTSTLPCWSAFQSGSQVQDKSNRIKCIFIHLYKNFTGRSCICMCIRAIFVYIYYVRNWNHNRIYKSIDHVINMKLFQILFRFLEFEEWYFMLCLLWIGCFPNEKEYCMWFE